MFPSMTIFPNEKLFRLFLYAIFIGRSSSCSSSCCSSSNNALIFAAVSIIIVIILQVIDYDMHIFVHLLSCADSVVVSCSC
jgi:hypothetical protein